MVCRMFSLPMHLLPGIALNIERLYPGHVYVNFAAVTAAGFAHRKGSHELVVFVEVVVDESKLFEVVSLTVCYSARSAIRLICKRAGYPRDTC